MINTNIDLIGLMRDLNAEFTTPPDLRERLVSFQELGEMQFAGGQFQLSVPLDRDLLNAYYSEELIKAGLLRSLVAPVFVREHPDGRTFDVLDVHGWRVFATARSLVLKKDDAAPSGSAAFPLMRRVLATTVRIIMCRACTYDQAVEIHRVATY